MKMAFDLGAPPLFPTLPGQPPSLASLWTTAGAPTPVTNFGGLAGMPLGGMPSLYGAPPSVLDTIPLPKPEVINGFGKLTWLSGKAGLITCANQRVISFQIKDFCDNQLVDLTAVLRVGFTLSFQATMSEANEYIATLVSPLYGAESDKVFANASEANLDEITPTTQPGNNKDAYSLRIEERAIPVLLAIFQRHAVPQIQLSSLHSQMSSVSGTDDELFRYVGSSSLKRRQFIERRTHLFVLAADDTITLQQPSIYSCVLRLASHLLRRGGVTAIESLYEFYMSAAMPREIREIIGESRSSFIELLQQHPWIFSLFPNRTYVSVRRNLPHFDYPEFVRTYFAESELFRRCIPRPEQHKFLPQHGSIQRTMSTHSAAMPPALGAASIMAQRHQSVGSGSAPGRPHSLWDNEVTSPLPPSNPSDWFGAASQTWTPQPLIPSLGRSNNKVSAVATQTDMMHGEPIGGFGCVCSCKCGARNARAPSLSGGSVSPPSAPLTANHTPPGTASPIGGHNRPAEMRLPSLDSSIRYYDPFGYDLNSPNLAALNIS